MQERIDLAGRLADHRVGQPGQQAEVARGRVELLHKVEVVLRLARFLEQGREGQEHFVVQLAGRRLIGPLPRRSFAPEPLAEPIFVGHLVDVDQGPVVQVAPVGHHVPVGQGAVLGRQELVGRRTASKSLIASAIFPCSASR